MISAEKLTEIQIIERMEEGETDLFEMIVRRYNPYLYKIGRSFNYNHEDTQDLMQDTFLDAYRNLRQFGGRSEFRTWIIRIMMNNCFRKRGKSGFKNEIPKEMNDNSIPMYTSSNRDTDQVIQNRELARILEDALLSIPFDYRMVFSLREINGLNISDTAGILDISEANVKVRLNRAKTMMKNAIEKTYSTNAIFEFNLVYCDSVTSNVMEKVRKSESV